MVVRMVPERRIRCCGADCGLCETYQRYLRGDAGGVVNPENGYRCCWLPSDYPEGVDCPIRACCDEQGIVLCGECERFETCDRMRAFYAQPGYDKLRTRMLEEVVRRRTKCTLESSSSGSGEETTRRSGTA